MADGHAVAAWLACQQSCESADLQAQQRQVGVMQLLLAQPLPANAKVFAEYIERIREDLVHTCKGGSKAKMHLICKSAR